MTIVSLAVGMTVSHDDGDGRDVGDGYDLTLVMVRLVNGVDPQVAIFQIPPWSENYPQVELVAGSCQVRMRTESRWSPVGRTSQSYSGESWQQLGLFPSSS